MGLRIGRGALALGQGLGQLLMMKKQQELQNRQFEREDERFNLQREDMLADRDQEAQLRAAELQTKGFVPTGAARAIGSTLGAGVGSMLSPTVNVGGQDLTYAPPPKAPERKWATERLGNQVFRVDLNSGDKELLGDAPPQAPIASSFTFLPTEGGIVAGNTRTGTVTPINNPRGGGALQSAPKAGDVDPASAMEAISNYEALTNKWFALSPLARLAALSGKGNQDLVGNLRSAAKTMAFVVKGTEGLGQISGADIGLVEGAIGNPLSVEAQARGKDYTLSQIRNYKSRIQQKLAGGPRAGTAGPAPDDVITSLINKHGGNVEAIRAELKQMGYDPE
jgi:hypothetical protein